jgi:hypothetical protein
MIDLLDALVYNALDELALETKFTALLRAMSHDERDYTAKLMFDRFELACKRRDVGYRPSLTACRIMIDNRCELEYDEIDDWLEENDYLD